MLTVDTGLLCVCAMFTDLNVKQQHSFVMLTYITEKTPIMAITTETARTAEFLAGGLSYLFYK